MSLIALPPQTKTPDLRIERLERATAQANGIYTRQFAPDDSYISRVLSDLIENRTMVSAHVSATVDHIVETVPADLQLQEVRRRTDDMTDLLTRSALAIARLRAHLANNTGLTA